MMIHVILMGRTHKQYPDPSLATEPSSCSELSRRHCNMRYGGGSHLDALSIYYARHIC